MGKEDNTSQTSAVADASPAEVEGYLSFEHPILPNRDDPNWGFGRMPDNRLNLEPEGKTPQQPVYSFTDDPDAGPKLNDFPRVDSIVGPLGGRYLDRLTSEERKQHPMCTGFVDYFPDAMALVAHVSWRGNQKHNPGQELHHARGKSADHADCVVRHQSTRCDADDGVPLLHAAEAAWRVFAQLQEMMEDYYGLDLPKGAREVAVSDKEQRCERNEHVSSD